METVFIEIDKCIFNTDADIVIGVIYRMPNFSVDVFSDRISDVMSVIQKERKLCYLWGDLNIDVLKADDLRATGELFDVLYCYNVFPLTTKATRVTSTTANLIDHILTNNLDDDMMHIQGISWTSISDHCAVFHVASNVLKKSHKDWYAYSLTESVSKKYYKIHFWNEHDRLAICTKRNRHSVGL